jgi:hypothetical protein
MTTLLELGQAEQRLRPFGRRYLGVRAIPVASIVGTDSRSADFDRDFRPLRPELRLRRQRLAQRFPEGDFPPIVVSKLGDAYFVLDGHHRVAVARRIGMETIDAEVTELRTFWQLGPDAHAGELAHGEQLRIFMEESGLAEVTADVCLSFSSPSRYREVLDSVHSHGYRLMQERGQILEPREVAADWYEHVYLGALETFHREGLEPQATKGDLFLCVQERRRELMLERSGATLEDAAREVLAADEERSRPRLRRLLSL